MVRVALIALLSVVVIAPSHRRRADITLDDTTLLQVMRGWEASAPGWRLTTDAFLQQVVDRGVNRVRVEIGAQVENDTDYLLNYLLICDPPYPDNTCDPGPPPGQSPQGDALNANRYVVVNDNGDPNVWNVSGGQWTGLDQAITRTVNPMRSKLQNRGESLYVNLCYVAFSNSIPAKNAVHQDPAEYAEFILAAFDHIDDTYGWVPNGVEIILEPDNSQNFWGNPLTSPTLVGQMVKATGDRLAAAGYFPDFIMPSPTSYASFDGYWQGMLATTGALAYVKEGSYHAYNTTGGLAPIAALVQAQGLTSSMLEWWDASNTYAKLYEYITDGYSSAYQRGVVQPLSEEDYYTYLQQYFVPVRMGAQRIGASSSNGALAPLAFINTNGAWAVVVKATSAQSFTVGDLPTGTYAIHYTTATETNTILTPQSITAGQDISTSIPAAGVIAIYANPLTSPGRLPFRIGRGAQ